MEKDFVPYEPSFRLKALGFDEECFSYYDLNNKPNFFGADNLMDTHCVQVNRPTFSQAFRWFREEYNIVGEINSYYSDKEWSFNYDIVTIFKEKASDRFNNYEEAELACLNKLIEIVETKIKK